MGKLIDYIVYLEEQIGEPYVWGGQHTKLTPENYVAVINKKEAGRGSYPDGTSYADAAIAYCKAKFDEGATVLYAYDCSGLGMYYLQNLSHIYTSDMNANRMMSKCEIVENDPKKGYWVFRKDDTGKATHIGYMIDDTYLVEAKGRKYGVTKTKFRAKDWSCWGIPECFKDDIDPEPEPPDPPTPPEPPVVAYKVLVIGKSVNVRDSDSKAGKVMFTAHKGNRFNLIDFAPSGWYHIETYKGPGYISNREDLTCLMTVMYTLCP